MKTKQSCLQEVNRHEADKKLLNVRVSAPVTENQGEKAKSGAGTLRSCQPNLEILKERCNAIKTIVYS